MSVGPITLTVGWIGRHGESFPKVQIITVDELLAGKRPRMPATTNPYTQARKLKASTPIQPTLGIVPAA